MTPRTLDYTGFVSAQDPRTMPGAVQPPVTTAPIRSLQNEPNTPPTPSPVSGASATPDFQSIINLLKQTQSGANTTLNQANQQQITRGLSTDPGLIGASPGQQDQARTASMNALSPTIGGAKDVISQAKQAITDYTTAQNQARDDARAVVNEILTTTDPTSLHNLNKDELALLEKNAGYPKGFLTEAVTYKQKTAALAAQKLASTNNGNGTNTELAQQLVDGTLDPSQLSKRTTNYNAVLSEASRLSKAQTGKDFNIAQAAIDYKFANQSQTQNTLNYLVSLTGGPGGPGNLDQLKNLSASIGRTSFPALNNVSAWTKLQTGNPQIAAYYATMTEVADQVAKILQGGGTGSGTSDAKLNQAAQLFQVGFSKEQLNAVIDSLKGLLNSRGREMIGNNRYLKASYGDRLDLSKPSTNTAQPSSFKLPNGSVVNLQSDGTYK